MPAQIKKGSGTFKRPCKNSQCVSAYQDKLYGKGIRIFNVKPNGARCTVCNTETKES